MTQKCFPLKYMRVKVWSEIILKCCWTGQEVCLGVSGRCYQKSGTNFLANWIHIVWGILGFCPGCKLQRNCLAFASGLKPHGKWSRKGNFKKTPSNLHCSTSTLLRKSPLSWGTVLTAFDLAHKMMNKLAHTCLRRHDISMHLTSQTHD